MSACACAFVNVLLFMYDAISLEFNLQVRCVPKFTRSMNIGQRESLTLMKVCRFWIAAIWFPSSDTDSSVLYLNVSPLFDLSFSVHLVFSHSQEPSASRGQVAHAVRSQADLDARALVTILLWRG